MSNIPSDMVAVLDKSRDQWWIYYLTSDTESPLRILKGPIEGQREDESPAYKGSTIPLDEVKPQPPSPPKPGNTQLGVLEWFDEATQKSQTRVYYLDANNTFVELGWATGSGGWFTGDLTSKELEAIPGSVITTAMTKDELKVYYRGKDKDKKTRLFVAWAPKNGGRWDYRPIASFD